jgi:2-oxoglutarate dehydrogenase E2 component (dihydrolipoamide succinyltransferase)
VPDIVNVARTDPELAQPLLAAENTATGNDPRGGLAELLAEVAGEGEPAPEKDNGEIVDVEYTAGAETLATESGVDLAEVEGTGKDGRITKGDVEAHIDAQAEGQE